MSQTKKTISIVVISILLLVSAVHFAAAKEQNIKISQSQNLGSVTLKKDVTADISNLIMIPSNNGQTVGFTLTIHNNSNSELDFFDYWINLYSKAGTSYSVNTTKNDVSKIPAKSSHNIMFYSQIGSNIKLSDLVMEVVEWDFSYPDFTKVLGKISIPTRYNATIPANEGRIINADNTKISMIINHANIGKSDKYFRPDLRLTIKNEGNQTLTLPEYEISILTNNGLLYPMTVKNLKGSVLPPLTEKEFQLTASIPIEVKEGNWKLAITVPVNEGNVKFPLALFQVPNNSSNDQEVVGKFYTFTNANGVYNIKLDSLNRLPLEDNDLIVANLTLANPGSETLPVPKLAAKFDLNNSIEKTGTISINNKIISIAPGASIQIQAVSSVPYTFEISNLNLVIQQKETEGSTEELFNLVQFAHSGDFDSVPVIDSSKGYVIEDLGYRAELTIRNLMTFEGSNASIVAAEINAENLEKRITDLQKFAGYFEMSNGAVYPATIQNINEKINPGGKAILYAMTTVPKGTEMNNIKLVIGKAVESGTEENVQLIGYVNPRSFILPEEKKAQNHLQQIDLIPYKFSIERVATKARFDNSTIQLEFDYFLEQDLLTKNSLKDRKIVIELVDINKKSIFSRELTIAAAGSEAGENQLKLGRNTIELAPWQDDKLVTQINALKDFDFNVYVEIQPGYKKLVATQKLPWLVNRTLIN